MTNKKILLLSTGGTIASVASEEGLIPGQSGAELLHTLGGLPYDVTAKDILALDSTNIQPEEWAFIAEKSTN
ncbi:L-asparginase [Lactobacillus equicursoris 66c]|uniref:asparaginase n=1 Tax=Lactobacillus equicursoris 66c TaxID=872326 RepID=K0NF26_9LACO|nr:L-asparginase [Lactobacillus equicursoris 66c]CCK83687.1 L-asparginase [Lactobacillus equicursoris 66c]